ncbi:MAG: hypothetical protein DMD96_00700 [Candidatus Rokuibacteriota bacterium]|nr:MAG: hypothetical protein DMD96_00700 [Candidatus Rokubacteria bacterium]
MTERSGDSLAAPRPRWGRLYALAALMLAALAMAEMLVSPGPELTALRCGLVLGGFGAMVRWTRRNRAALDRLDWCDCAGERVTMRVIPSRSGRPARAAYADEPTPVGATLEEVAR